jgi:bifunctional ADP-heptose synthase (sugar kinase/adenylyltransferase)
MNILVIGEKCVDIFIYGDCHRLSPEAPVPVIVPNNIVKNDGMAGNVVNNIFAIDKEINVDIWSQNQEITKTRYVDRKTNHMFLRVDKGEEGISEMETFHNKISEISKYDIVIVSDYDKGFISTEMLKQIGHSSKLSILDSKKILSKEIIEKFTFVKMNESESKQNSQINTMGNVIVTLGSMGAKFKGTLFPSPKPQETIDVSGAGDTFTASFILKYYKTKDVNKSISYANEMSSIVVSRRGVSTV